MKSFTLAAATLAALAAPALAGGPTMIADDPMPAAAPAPAAVHDWSGFYAGLSYGKTSGDVSDPFATFDYDGDKAVGGFLGYNVQRGNLVYGGELGYAKTDTLIALGGGDDTLDSLLDLRGRLGWTAGNALFYGAIGYSTAEQTINATNGATLSGVSYGLGVDVMVINRLFLGLDYTSRNVNGRDDLDTFDLDSTINTVTLRAGFSF